MSEPRATYTCPDCRQEYLPAPIAERIEGCARCEQRGGPYHYSGQACRSGGLRHPGCPARGREPHCTCDYCF